MEMLEMLESMKMTEMMPQTSKLSGGVLRIQG